MSDVVIVEDDHFFRKYLANLLVAIPGIEVTGVFADGEEFLNLVQKLKPDILFLDVGLPGISGIQVAECVRRDFPYMEMVFITADENHIWDAFHLYASDFITKPLDPDRLRYTVDRIKRKSPVLGAKIKLNCVGEIEMLIEEENIYMVEALAKKTVIYTAIRIITCLHSMKDMEARLDKNMFFRTSRSYLVNLRLVEGIKSYSRTSYQKLFKNKDYQAYLQKGSYPKFREQIKNLSKTKGGEI